MIQLGKRQKLVVVKQVEFGVYLAESEETAQERVLLPIRQVPEGTGKGDAVDVFIYKDSSDRLIATTREVELEVGGVALLKVGQVGRIGAFLKWNLEKDLLLPFREQTRKVSEGELCLVGMYVDKSERLCATMKLYPYLRTDSPYKAGDTARGRVYDAGGNFGVFLAVDDCYQAMIPNKEAQAGYRPGDEIMVRVVSVRDDGKLTVSPNQKAWLQMDVDADKILKKLEEFAGVLPFDDKVSPEIIKREFGISKAAFKRAAGRLKKQGKIRIAEGRISRLETEEQK